ncbi:MAG TPA: hypothetical protein VGE23_00600 [Candidatus Paceibacterota bacterium]
MSELITIMASVLGDTISVWLLFLCAMAVGGLLGRLTYGFKQLTLFDLGTVLLVIAALASAMGARFADTGISVLVGLIAGALMLAMFIIITAIAPRRDVREPVAVGASSLGSAPARFQTAAGYDEQGRPRG